MRLSLAQAIMIGAAVAAVLTEICLLRLVGPAGMKVVLLAGLWLATPYLVTPQLVHVFRRHRLALVGLAVFGLFAAFTALVRINHSVTHGEHYMLTAVVFLLIPPAQLAAMVIAAMIGLAVSRRRQRGQAKG